MSHHYLEVRLAKQLGPQIDRWKIKKEHPFHANGRCPICGDSTKSKTKARFHIIERDSTLFVHCFNCDLSTNFVTFVKQQYPHLYNEYVFERYKRNDSPTILAEEPSFKVAKIERKTKLDIPYVADLPDDHPVKQYVASRKLPDYPFQMTTEFYKLVSMYNDDVEHIEGRKDETRLIIPFFDREGNVHAFQGRDMSGKSAQKYITVIVNPKVPKIFGICQVDFKKEIYMTEGPLDSLFLPNAIASVNAALSSTADKICAINNNLKDRMTLILDNEPRNSNVLKQYRNAIESNYRVVIWPNALKHKDINDMVLTGLDPLKIIKKHTFRGLLAEMEFNKWKRINV